PNAINSRYADIIVQINENSEVDVPKITVSRLGKIVVNGQLLQKHPKKNLKNLVYVYPLFVPSGWNGDEVKWEIYYLGRSMVSGDLKILDER
ncbi:MAG: hypothetical protein ACPL7B_14415, partial [Candidatus Poribacteria bacterium]